MCKLVGHIKSQPSQCLQVGVYYLLSEGSRGTLHQDLTPLEVRHAPDLHVHHSLHVFATLRQKFLAQEFGEIASLL